MQKTGIAHLPLHSGKAPRWLFSRMVKLASAITDAILLEYNQEEFLKRISSPFWFQALSCVLGYDWHSSGCTTVTCGALKEALNKANLGIKIGGGKGNISKKSPDEIDFFSQDFNLSTNKIERLKYSSKMSAKVDNSCIQDNYNLYHHSFIFTENGSWAVIQQGMNSENNYARRYHWLSDNIVSFVTEPHEAICCDKKQNFVLDMTAKESEEARKTSLDLVKDNPKNLERYLMPIQKTINDFSNKSVIELKMPPAHLIKDMKKINIETLKKAYEIQPKNYEELVAIKGIGPKTIRSLALISDLVYGKKASWKDPVKYSFAHGGKDRIPYPVNKRIYDSSTEILKNAIRQAKLGEKDKLYAIKRLHQFYE